MPNNVKTYDGSDDLEDHLKIFQAATKVECWAMPTWCHMFNSTLTGSARVWFDDLPPESIDSYDDLKKAFLANYLQQKKCIKDPIEIHHIKKREGESTEDFVQRFKAEISREMMRVTTAFLRGEVTASNQARKKAPPTWKQQEVGRKQNFDRRGDFRNQQRSKRRRDKFTLLTKSPKEILALDKGKFKTPPPMTTPVEKRNSNKFCEFHGEVGHNTDECMHLKRQIEELIKNGKLSHVIKELKQAVAKSRQAENYTKLLPQFENFAPSISKKPDGSSYYTPYRLKWRNNMANGTNTAASKNRGRGTFHLYMDEFHGSKITVFLQWDHRKISISKANADGETWKYMFDGLGDQKSYRALNNKGHGRDIQNPEGNKHEVKPKEMHLRNRGRHVPGIQTEAAVKETKKLIVELPTLTAPMEKEELIVYLTAVREAVRAVLMTKREAKQMPVYFVSRTLQDLEINYTSMKKLVLALVYASKRLKRYFQAHIIIIITDQLIKQILSRPEVTRRLQKWSIKLGKYDIQYRPRTLVKGQILVDFIVECLEDDPLDRPIKTEEE
ncbi:reverse transcriptase domain-containing protein [Tanacetum coccineum]